ncbi:hypothetical protein F4802DRAFT_550321 [Xylaria palmicola]|nr:hypothetical protein F4802DRAFT_550321 [Xylaria palmicola]
MLSVEYYGAKRKHFGRWKHSTLVTDEFISQYVVIKDSRTNLKARCLTDWQRELYDKVDFLAHNRRIIIHRDYVNDEMFYRQSHVYAAIIFRNGEAARSRAERCEACRTKIDKGRAMIFPECVRFDRAPVPGACCACANCKWHDTSASCSFVHPVDSDHHDDDDDDISHDAESARGVRSSQNTSADNRNMSGQQNGRSLEMIVISSDSSDNQSAPLHSSKSQS